MNIPIVQGKVVQPEPAVQGGGGYTYDDSKNSGPYTAAPTGPADVPTAQASERPTPRHQYQDVVWAILFYAQLGVVVAYLCMNIVGGSGGGNASSVDMGLVTFLAVCGLVSVGLASFTIVALKNSNSLETLIQMGLIFSVASSLGIGIVGFMMGSLLMGIMGMVFFCIGVCYARLVWSRIPFAASNLKTALTAVHESNMCGLASVAYIFMTLAFVWSVLWFVGLNHVFAGADGGDDGQAEILLPVMFLLFVSYYWVHQVCQNTVHVTTTGLIGTWWFVPSEATGSAIWDSFRRATTYSFGSICLGSLLVAIVQALRALEYYTRDNDDFQILSCIIQCILSCIQGIIEYLNKWAYVYVGLYGFSYLDAGRNVINLFQQKGWTVIITDDLTENVLFMMSLAVGLVCGVLGLLLGWMDPGLFAGLTGDGDGSGGATMGIAFVVAFLIGYVLASILLVGVVGSAVNTVIVCYAEAPAEFQANHPELSNEMRQSWIQAWPGLTF